MQIQVTTDNHIAGDARLIEYSQSQIRDALGRFQDRITRVDVHLGDEDGPARQKRGSDGDDKRCALEAHLAGHQPVVATHHAATVKDALGGAVHKLEKLLNGIVEREQDRRRR
jgi:ribosome-associated translation inhibitor RaiA